MTLLGLVCASDVDGAPAEHVGNLHVHGRERELAPLAVLLTLIWTGLHDPIRLLLPWVEALAPALAQALLHDPRGPELRHGVLVSHLSAVGPTSRLYFLVLGFHLVEDSEDGDHGRRR